MATKQNDQTYRLTSSDAVTVWQMRREGYFQHQIAAHFGVNPGRINDVLKGRKFPEAQLAAMPRDTRRTR